jgi:hypothetical protein
MELMEDIPINLVITMDNIVAFLGVVLTLMIALVGGIYAIITNTKKYELTENYRKELLYWYTSAVQIMIKIIHCIERGEFLTVEFSLQRTELLSQLSALTEVGRFYFPNVLKNDGFGSEKPSAYRGYRHINLEFLLYFYQIALKSNCDKYCSLLWKLERNFTAVIFDMIEPRKRNHDYSKYLAMTIPKGQAIEDYIAENPNNDVFK